MSGLYGQGKQRATLAIQTSPSQEAAHIPEVAVQAYKIPKVVIRGDIRLQMAESDLAFRTVKGSYSIDTEDMLEPLQVIWIVEGKILDRKSKTIAGILS